MSGPAFRQQLGSLWMMWVLYYLVGILLLVLHFVDKQSGIDFSLADVALTFLVAGSMGGVIWRLLRGLAARIDALEQKS